MEYNQTMPEEYLIREAMEVAKIRFGFARSYSWWRLMVWKNKIKSFSQFGRRFIPEEEFLKAMKTKPLLRAKFLLSKNG